MFRALLFVGFLSSISFAIAEEPRLKEVGNALSAFAASVNENIQTRLLNGTNLGQQICSSSTHCQDGYKCCSETTCCQTWLKCCGNGRLCCVSSATTARSTLGLVTAAILLYFGTSLMQSKN